MRTPTYLMKQVIAAQFPMTSAAPLYNEQPITVSPIWVKGGFEATNFAVVVDRSVAGYCKATLWELGGHSTHHVCRLIGGTQYGLVMSRKRSLKVDELSAQIPLVTQKIIARGDVNFGEAEFAEYGAVTYKADVREPLVYGI